jgi:diguanylate cyclase (GGDEF)-like protein
VTGRPEEIVSIARDVTARKREEAARAAEADELAHQAATDALTGLANRRRFDEALEQEWQRARREGKPLSLLLIDADCFKLYNDTYGHQSGDQALRNIAESIQVSMRRSGDLAARYGGEEFAVILPNASQDGAMRVAEAIRRAVATWNMPHERGPAGAVSVSVGAASMVPTAGVAAAVLVTNADKALYAAKAGGRNRTALNGPGGRSATVA